MVIELIIINLLEMKKSELTKFIKENILNTLSEATEDEIENQK